MSSLCVRDSSAANPATGPHLLIISRFCNADAVMGFSKDDLLARLQELQIEYSRYDHPVVLTVEAQEKHIGHVGGGTSKNLFFKDKKHRFYVVSALKDTTVDLKVLSQRLGLGKGGLRMAPQEALQQILQVPLGCVTPFALINDSARDVSLLLDQGFKAQECCFFHPLSNDVSISLKASDLDKFLISIGREPSYVDFKAEVTVGKDQPPDLAALVPSGAIAIPDVPGKTVPEKPTSENHLPVASKPEYITEKSVKKQSNHTQCVKETPVRLPPNILDIEYFVNRIIDSTSSLVLSQITSDTIQQHGEQLGGAVADALRKNLGKDFKSLATQLKNVAYTEGFQSAAQCSGYSQLLNKKCLP